MMNDTEILNWIERHLGNFDISKTADSNLYEARKIAEDPDKTYRAQAWHDGEGGPQAYGPTMRDAIVGVISQCQETPE